MSKILKSIIFATLFVLMEITTACNLPSSTSSNTMVPSTVTATSTYAAATPTEFVVPAASATPEEFAPLCASINLPPLIECQVQSAEESSTFCAKKKPYNLILINKGATYEVLTKGFICSNAGVKDDKQLVTCTGQMASVFEVSVCDPACIVPTVQAKTTQCPPDYNYNDRQGCCTESFQQIQQNCTILKFQTTSCLVDCSVYTKKSTCDNNSIACVWNDKGKKCEPRK